ncbi:reverse transcriptase-like protein [Lachnospiraceae bacterium]|nr:reverse transcriptase-like protein [Lachnospiraceae bacterium]
MAKKKFYAVRKGLQAGIYESWQECQAVIDGYSNAEYKGFSTKEEAERYMGGIDIDREGQTPGPEPAAIKPETVLEDKEMPVNPAKVIAYVDGSYEDKLKKYSFGCIILTPSGEIIRESGNGNNPASLAIRNVAGEMLGAMYAVKWAMVNGYKEIELRYDYAGIEKWVQGEWKAKNELAQKYAAAMNEWKKNIHISFLKIAAHSNNKYNDMADELAKSALLNADGIPKIRKR